MSEHSHRRSHRRGLKVGLAVGASVLAVIAVPAVASAGTSSAISTDPFTQATCAASVTTNHHANVEPDTFSNGSTIVAAFQVGRIYDGGACAIGFATSTNNGSTWTNGLLPGITKWSGGGRNDRATDASVAYDAKHNAWLVSSLTLLESGGVHGNALVTSRSTDGGLTWGPRSPPRPAVTWIRTGSCATTPPPARTTAAATPSGTTTATATVCR